MNELIEQIIHIQSLQMQQYTINDLESEAVDIAEIIGDIGQDVCFEFQHKNIYWQWQAPEFVCSVLGNQEQLYSALENVIRNAFMHTPPDSTVTAEVLMLKTNDHKNAIQISITDEGGGVADKDLERIFQPFVRLDSARHRQTGGYGLGLAIVYAVVMAHKGQLTVHNRQDSIEDGIQNDIHKGIKGLVVQIVLPTSE
jgi:two-component system sensor histidine kinase CpxA